MPQHDVTQAVNQLFFMVWKKNVMNSKHCLSFKISDRKHSNMIHYQAYPDSLPNPMVVVTLHQTKQFDAFISQHPPGNLRALTDKHRHESICRFMVDVVTAITHIY
jgi:hypothetical protein